LTISYWSLSQHRWLDTSSYDYRARHPSRGTYDSSTNTITTRQCLPHTDLTSTNAQVHIVDRHYLIVIRYGHMTRHTATKRVNSASGTGSTGDDAKTAVAATAVTDDIKTAQTSELWQGWITDLRLANHSNGWLYRWKPLPTLPDTSIIRSSCVLSL
jgi:hypothetical protein